MKCRKKSVCKTGYDKTFIDRSVFEMKLPRTERNIMFFMGLRYLWIYTKDHASDEKLINFGLSKRFDSWTSDVPEQEENIFSMKYAMPFGQE